MSRLYSRGAAFASLLALTLIPTIAFASTTSGGSAGGLQFPTMVKNLAAGVEIVAGAAVIIALFTVIGAAVFHREDMGGLMRNAVFVIIGGSIMFAGSAFFSQLGGAAAAAVIH